MGTASPDKKTSSSAFIATSAQPERPVATRSAKAGAHKASATESGDREVGVVDLTVCGDSNGYREQVAT